jgi:Na+/melibiose symporter-like transporter
VADASVRNTPRAAPAGLSFWHLLAYAQFGMPLAMAALPLYVHLPNFYAGHLGVPLATLGFLLLGLRLFDAVIDPVLGVWSDNGRSRKRLVAMAAPVLAVGIMALFRPPQLDSGALLVWLGISLLFVYTAFSLATINHGAWGAELSADPVERTRITATREGLALFGVIFAAAAPAFLGGGGPGGEALGLWRFALVFAGIVTVCALVLWMYAPDAPRVATVATPLLPRVRAVLTDTLFVRLLVVFVFNGIAAAIPATLLLFFIADVLGTPQYNALFLVLYFLAGACGMPLWFVAAKRWGKVRAWQVGMVAAVIAFVWAALLGPGDVAAFGVVCVLSGLALGADVALPPSLLADVIGRVRGTAGRSVPVAAQENNSGATGAYFGIWTLATKLNLALAAGVALPLVAWLGYTPGAGDHKGLVALAFVYAGVPSLLKLVAAFTLFQFDRHWKKAP